MNLPIKFPSNVEVITEEVARFRALSPEDRVKALGDAFRLYHDLMKLSGRSAEMAQFAEAEEERGRKAILDFVARHSPTIQSA